MRKTTKTIASTVLPGIDRPMLSLTEVFWEYDRYPSYELRLWRGGSYTLISTHDEKRKGQIAFEDELLVPASKRL